MEVADEAAHCRDVAKQDHSLIVAVLIVTIGKVIRSADGSSSARPQVLEGNLGHRSHPLPPCVSCGLPAANCYYCACSSGDTTHVMQEAPYCAEQMPEATMPIAFRADLTGRAICCNTAAVLGCGGDMCCLNRSTECLVNTAKATQARKDSSWTHQNQHSQWSSEPYQIE